MERFNLEPFIHEVEQKKLDLYGTVVRQRGEITGSFRWRNNDRINIRSASKGVTCMAIGMAIEEGLVKLSDKVVDFFPEKLPAEPSQNLLEVTVRDLLMMATGHEVYLLQPTGRDAIEGDWLEFIFRQPVAKKPGTRFVYNNAAPYLCSAILNKVTGQDIRDWLMPRLFEPLGIRNPQWFKSPQNLSLSLGGLFLTTEELSRLGQLCLNRGEWEGRQLVSAAWIDEATKLQIKTETTMGNIDRLPEKDFAAGYGYFFWRNMTEGYRFNGKYGQFCIVLPERDAVVTTTSFEENDEQGILDAVWKCILPQL